MTVHPPHLWHRASRLVHIDVLIPLLVITAVALAAMACSSHVSAADPASVAAAGPADDTEDKGDLPDPRLAGEWTGNARVIVSWCQQEQLPLSFTIHADASVSGKVGDARLVDARVSSNRGAIGRALKIKTDFIIQGKLDGWLVAAEEIGRDAVNVPFALTDGVLHGAVHSSGLHVGPPSKMVFSASFENLTRTLTDFTERTPELQPRRFGSLKKLTTLDGVYFASQPSSEDMELARKAGLASVLNLRHAEEMDFDEAALAQQLGLEYLNPAFNGAEALTDELLDGTREVLLSVQRPLLFHCGSANRVGAVWLAHRVLDDQLAFDEALLEAQAIGLRTPAYEARVREYVQRRQD